MKRSFVLGLTMLLGAVMGSQSVVLATGVSASATLRTADGSEVGSATFTETPAGVELVLRVHDLPAGKHGFHVHGTGSCKPPDFKSAGGHFNPEGKEHGRKNPRGHHLGDLPNLEVGPDGKGEVKVVIRGATLGEGKSSLLRSGGTAVVIHAQADDERSDPAGNAGRRIACGVIESRSH